MALKPLILVGFVVASVAVEMSEAQIGNNCLLAIPVTLHCTPDGNMGILGLATPPFNSADVVFQCGNNVTTANATTNSFGFSYVTTRSKPVLPFFPPESNCKLVVGTTLSTCNNTLPSTDGLQSGLKFIGNFVVGSLNAANRIPLQL